MGDRLRDGGHRPLSAGAAPPGDAARRRFITAETRLAPVPLLPEIRLYQADDATALWQRTEDALGASGLALPFWAFAWAGGRGLARHVLDHPELVRGRRVLDFAAGSGLVGIASALAGAASVAAVDIDPFAVTAIDLNAAANGVAVAASVADLVGRDVDADMLVCGDIFYDRAMTAAVLPWLRSLAAAGIDVFAGDPGRRYCPSGGVALCGTVQVPVEIALEDSLEKAVRILAVLPDAG